ncbi:MAG: glycogen debranching protein GlgX [Thermodesulfobacteriota bacterium]
MQLDNGSPLPLGISLRDGWLNFALFSRHAEQLSLVLFRAGEGRKWREIIYDPEVNRTGDIWHIALRDVPEKLRYGYRLVGPSGHDGHCFQPERLVLDPYAPAISGGEAWGQEGVRPGGKQAEHNFIHRGIIYNEDFDWQGDRPLNIPLHDSIIYELHVRGFTRHPSSQVAHPGTYRGIVDKIPYLKKLGVTAVELMPVSEFAENEKLFSDPASGGYLKNFWGYNSFGFFAPKASYGAAHDDGNQVREFKEMVRSLHQAGIEVILDVVFNHTGEGGYDGPLFNFRGLDNSIYYLLDSDKNYLNFSGCGNTVNCNHPLVRDFIMDCLRYWVVEMHVDGFRFDLASILGRSPSGAVLNNPPVVEMIAEDPVLANTKIIAEAWDAAGLYQVGSFSTHRRWAEWNGPFRDDVRTFMCGRENMVSALATRLAGSSDLYKKSGRAPFNSINFITSHDGFTLADLVSYNDKHNEANGEGNRDGENHNCSWNSGAEGTSADKKINRLRQTRLRSLAVLLFVAQGTPMLTAGDEFGRSQQGNNNAWCQDNEISWLNWQLAADNRDQLLFFRRLIRLRRAHRVFRRCDFFSHNDKRPEITWQGLKPGSHDWSATCHTLAFLLHGDIPGGRRDDDFFIMINGGCEPATFTIPKAPEGRAWHLLLNSAARGSKGFAREENAPLCQETGLTVAPMAARLLISKAWGGPR